MWCNVPFMKIGPDTEGFWTGGLELNEEYVWEHSGDPLTFFDWIGPDPGIVVGSVIYIQCNVTITGNSYHSIHPPS